MERSSKGLLLIIVDVEQSDCPVDFEAGRQQMSNLILQVYHILAGYVIYEKDPLFRLNICGSKGF
jgi:hypothetical protein